MSDSLLHLCSELRHSCDSLPCPRTWLSLLVRQLTPLMQPKSLREWQPSLLTRQPLPRVRRTPPLVRQGLLRAVLADFRP